MRYLLLCCLALSCAAAAQAQTQTRPYAVAAASGSWTMTAKIDGKPFTATEVARPELMGRIVGYQKDELAIGMPYDRGKKVGEKTVFAEHNVVDLKLDDEQVSYAGTVGEMDYTKVGGGWIEGTFHFIAGARGTTKKVSVTDGFFRIKVQ